MADFSLRLLAFLAAPTILVAAQENTEGLTTNISPSPGPTGLGSFPTGGPTAPGRNTTFTGPRTTPRPLYTNTSRPIDHPTLTRSDPGAIITSWTTEIVTITSCPCAPKPDYGYGNETMELCTSSRTLTVTLTSTLKGCNHGYGGCKYFPEYPDYPKPTQEPPHYGNDEEGEEDEEDEEISCNEDGEFGGDENLGGCYGPEEGCDNYEFGRDGAGDHYEGGEDGHRESYDELKQKEYDREKRGGYDRRGGDGHGHKLKDIDHERDRQRHKKRPGKGYHHKTLQIYEERDSIPTVPEPPIKDFEVPIARHKREKRQHKCTKTGGPKPTDVQKLEPTGDPTGPKQCHGDCGGPDLTSTVVTTVMITITPSVTKLNTNHLSVSSISITLLSTTTLSHPETGSATGSSSATATSTAPSIPTFIAGAARLGREVRVATGWGILLACMWVGMVAIEFGMGGVGF
ncbi:hypothetical protein L211DRAFT_840764 [Terfezia boudieri ATCC MYA-4762]|uniref:Uncharacterized protein n=1 Tax=Terfezia boudieri ATCC MYA-4762 TaxID=1051890 RepID=A0A3N4LEM8_9PEZI|nr:hypothetical protein L211DRAFT_840764 [Terfezia boudieri ATCC MYA-4762]